jgi:hypothetical protein
MTGYAVASAGIFELASNQGPVALVRRGDHDNERNDSGRDV